MRATRIEVVWKPELDELVQREMENEKILKDGAQRSSIQGTAEGRNTHRRSRMRRPGHQGGQLFYHLPACSIVHKAWPGRASVCIC